MSQAAKDARDKELAAYMRTLTPEDIKKENAFRTTRRKAGKSRRANMMDPNAPKKPLSAYFMFLQRIRSDPELVEEVFGDETETTKQGVLAAAKWRSMTDEERKVCIHPFELVPSGISPWFTHSLFAAIFSPGRTGKIGLRSCSQTVREWFDRLRIEHRCWHYIVLLCRVLGPVRFCHLNERVCAPRVRLVVVREIREPERG